MESACPESKELEYFAMKSLDYGDVDPKIKAHIENCASCTNFVKKWKSYLKSEVFSCKPKIENYEIIRLIGIGTASKVYLARHTFLNKQVAIKVLYFTNEIETQREDFLKKSQILAQINHPSIIRLLDARMDQNGVCFLVFDYMEGESLEKILPLPLEQALLFMEQMISGLQELHQHHLLLEDIKPHVFLVDPARKIIRLSDFGFLKEKNYHGTNSALLTSLLPYYKSPEQCTGQMLITASDVYSLGATFYTMLNKLPPFSGYNLPETFRQVLNEPPPDLTKAHPYLPKELNQIIQQMMQKKPSERLFLEEALEQIKFLKKFPLLRDATPFFSEEKNETFPSKTSEKISEKIPKPFFPKPLFPKKETSPTLLKETVPIYPKKNDFFPRTDFSSKTKSSTFSDPKNGFSLLERKESWSEPFEEKAVILPEIKKSCPRCFELQSKFFTCSDCGEVLCLKHKEREQLCEICSVHQKPTFIKPDVFELLQHLEKYTHKEYLPNLNKIPNNEELEKVFESISHNPYGGFLIFSLKKGKQLGLMIQSNIIRVFLYGHTPIRSWAQYLTDLGVINALQLKTFELRPKENELDLVAQKFITDSSGYSQSYLKQSWLSQELVLFLMFHSSHVRYISGKVPENKINSLEPDILLENDTESFKQWLHYVGYALRTLEFSGNIVFKNGHRTELSIQLEEQRIRMIFFKMTEEKETSVSWEDHLAETQITFCEKIEQEHFLRDGDFCIKHQHSGRGSAVQKARLKMGQELKQVLELPGLQIEYIHKGIPQATLHQTYSIELTADYRSLLLCLLTRIKSSPPIFQIKDLLGWIHQETNYAFAAKALSHVIQKSHPINVYLKDFGLFEATLLTILGIKVLFFNIERNLLSLQETLATFNRKEDQKSILETGLLLFPDNENFSEKLSLLYRIPPSSRQE